MVGGGAQPALSLEGCAVTCFTHLSAAPAGTPPARERATPLGGVGALLAVLLVALASGCDHAPSPTSPDGAQADEISAAASLAFAQVSAGSQHSCGVTTTNVAYCWGYNGWGQLGDGTAVESRIDPVLVVGGLAFRQVSAGENHTCGVTTSNVAYCWGIAGTLGNGSQLGSVRPVRVSGGLAFRSVSAGTHHTCGVTSTNVAYCWGGNSSGQLGDGTKTRRLQPVRVVGGLAFREVSAGAHHTCGVTTSNLAYCWGSNPFGELGRGSVTGPETCSDVDLGSIPCSTRPVRVLGGLTFAQVSAGDAHACGVTTSNLTYCWGNNASGQLGNGTDTGPERCVNNIPCSTRPVRVTGGIVFRAVSAGGTRAHTCGVTSANVAYCWGSNSSGQLGDGTLTRRVRPVLVLGGLAFRQVGGGADHTCGVTPTNAAYCWGGNFYGQLGDGTTTSTKRPVRRVG